MPSQTSVRVVNIIMIVLMWAVAAINLHAFWKVTSVPQSFCFLMTAMIFAVCSFILVRLEVMNFVERRKASKQ